MRERRVGAVSLVISLVTTGLVATPGSAAQRKPDLVVATAKTGSTSVVAGEDIRVSDAVKNTGRGAAAASVTKYALSIDAKPGNDVKLPKVRKVPRLAPGKASKGAVTLTVPTSVPGADYKLLACADGTKKVAEVNERNNCSVAGDLAVYAASDHDLIEQALADGKIDAETAITYKIFSDFADPRLPAKYSGDDSLATESDVLNEVAQEWGSFSPETQAILEPFLRDPFNEGSWWDLAHEGGSGVAASRQTDTDYELQCDTTGPSESPLLAWWGYVDAAEGQVRVWYQKDYEATDRPVAEAMAAEIDATIWPKVVTQLMGGRAPKPDGGSGALTTCRGGTDAYDISLVDVARSITSTVGACEDTWARTFFQRSLPAAERNAVLAHELFHAIQFSYGVANGCLGGGSEYEWWKEASAQWVEDFVYPDYNGEHDYAPRLLDAPHYALDDPSGPGGRDRFYGEYLLPFYLARKGDPGMVRTIWDNTTGYGMTDALATSVGDFHAFWKRFVLANWNRGPKLDLYKEWDGLTDGVTPIDKTLVKGKFPLKTEVTPTSAQYLRLTPKRELTSIEFTNNNGGVPGAGIQLIVDYVDGTQKLLDWSNKETAVLCLENPEVKTVTFVFSNSAYNASVPPVDVVLEGKANLCCTGEGTDGTGDEANPPRAAQESGSTCPGVSGSFQYSSHDDYHNQELTYSVDFSTTPVEDYNYSVDEHAAYNITYSSNFSGTQFNCAYTYTENGSLSGTIQIDASGVVEPGEMSITGAKSEGREVVVSPNTLPEFEVPTTITETWSSCGNPTNNNTYTHAGTLRFDDDDLPYQGCTTGDSIQSEFIRYTGPPEATSLSVNCREIRDGGETRTLTGSLTITG